MSWGIPGFRVGVSANGRKYISLGIPGTGIYFTKYFNQQQHSRSCRPTQQQQKQQTQQPTIQQPLQSNNSQTINQKEIPWWKQKNL